MNYTRRDSFRSMSRAGGSRANSGDAGSYSSGGYVYRGNQPMTEAIKERTVKSQTLTKGQRVEYYAGWTEEMIQDAVKEFAANGIHEYGIRSKLRGKAYTRRLGLGREATTVQLFEAVLRHDWAKDKERFAYNATHSA